MQLIDILLIFTFFLMQSQQKTGFQFKNYKKSIKQGRLLQKQQKENFYSDTFISKNTVLRKEKENKSLISSIANHKSIKIQNYVSQDFISIKAQKQKSGLNWKNEKQIGKLKQKEMVTLQSRFLERVQMKKDKINKGAKIMGLNQKIFIEQIDQEKKFRNKEMQQFWETREYQQLQLSQKRSKQGLQDCEKNGNQKKYYLMDAYPKESPKESRNLQTLDPEIEYMRNVDYMNTTCAVGIVCHWNTLNFTSLDLPYWEPDPQIQVGAASGYKPGMSNIERVVELVAKSPTCIKQLITNLPGGIYELQYNYSARTGVPLLRCKIQVFLNNTLIDTKTPPDYNFQLEKVNVTIETNNTSIYLRFCADQSVSSTATKGALLIRTSFRNISKLPVVHNNTVNTTTNIISNQTITSTTTNTTSNQIFLQTNVNESEQSSNIISEEINQTINNSDELSRSFSIMLNCTMSNAIIKQAIKFPGVRKLWSSCFSFFVNLDHLWLYIYHQRKYASPMKTFFIQVRNLQDMKWNFFSEKFSNKGFFLDQIKQFLDFKYLYTPPSFFLVQQNSRQFVVNSFMFFMINVPLVLIIYFVGKKLHQLFLYWKLGFFLRQFALNSYLILVLFEGNSESFVYFLFSDLTIFFEWNFLIKLKNLTSLAFLFIIIYMLVSAPFILRYLYQNQRIAEFYEKSRNNFRGSIYFMVEFGLFNISLGSIHVLAQNYPNLQLLCLFLIEGIFILYNLLNFKNRSRVYQSKFKVWVSVWASFLRMKLIFTFYLFRPESEPLQQKIQILQKMYIILYLLLWIFCFIHSLIMQVISTIDWIIQKISSTKQLKKKQEQLQRKVQDLTNHSIFFEKSNTLMAHQTKRFSCKNKFQFVQSQGRLKILKQNSAWTKKNLKKTNLPFYVQTIKR